MGASCPIPYTSIQTETLEVLEIERDRGQYWLTQSGRGKENVGKRNDCPV
jgi:hypothetical protein